MYLYCILSSICIIMIFVFYYHSRLHYIVSALGTVADGANIKAFARHCPFCTLPRNRQGLFCTTTHRGSTGPAEHFLRTTYLPILPPMTYAVVTTEIKLKQNWNKTDAKQCFVSVKLFCFSFVSACSHVLDREFPNQSPSIVAFWFP